MGQHLPGVRCSRAVMDGELTIREGAREWQSPLMDLSLSGVRVRLPRAFDLRREATAELEIHGPRGEHVLAWAKLARLCDDTAAFRFDRLSAPSEARLRDLIKRGRLYDHFD
ncbi:MAG: PilZ domain-containing protein [Rhodanobacteraceae bacterium]|nr:PilZ domain-containing protein [Xanthomonadales bacterium]MCP5478363.1 PilZ domain-containing protein [Rhodanobacteraceae bacterium]HRX99333.1 PilZ domain-containing protein [Xanthomonadaceae bacterium]